MGVSGFTSRQSYSGLVAPGQPPRHHHPNHALCKSSSFQESPREHCACVQHNPLVNWSKGSILAWSPTRHASGLGLASSPVSVSCIPQVQPTDLTGVRYIQQVPGHFSASASPLQLRHRSPQRHFSAQGPTLFPVWSRKTGNGKIFSRVSSDWSQSALILPCGYGVHHHSEDTY